MDTPTTDAVSAFEVRFSIPTTLVGQEAQDIVGAFESRCQLEEVLQGRFQRRLTPTAEGTLGGFWEGVFAFLLTHLNQVVAVCRALQAACHYARGHKNVEFSVVITRAGGDRLEISSKQLELKDIAEVRKQVVKFLKDVPEIKKENQ